MKDHLPDLERELERLIKTDDENIVLVYARRCLEVIITDLCESELKRPRKTEPLKGIIDKLNREGKMPEHIIASMQNLNTLSTFGAHPKEFDPRQVKPVLVNLTTIIEWYLKHKDTQTISKLKAEKVKDETKGLDDSMEQVQKPKKRLILLLSGLALVVVIVVVALFVFDVIGGGKRIKELEKSIAVLPFDNMSVGEEFSHLGSSIADEIILELQKIKAFDRVISRSSTMQYSENRPTVPEMAENLGVNYLIEGSIQRYDDKVNIHVQVIVVRGKKESHVWGDKYTGEWKDIFIIQDEIAKDVANELKIVLSPEEIQQIEKIPTDNTAAYNQYLLGKYYYNQHTEESVEGAIRFFNRAIELDSTFALVYVYLAQSYQFMVRYGWASRDEVYEKAKTAVYRVIELDRSLGEAYAALGLMKIVFDWDIYGPDEEFRKAIRLSPNSAEVYASYVQYLRWIGRYDQGIIIAKRAIELDPLTPYTNIWQGSIYFWAGRYDESIYFLEEMLSRDSSFIYTYLHLAWAYSMKGLHQEAIYYADKTQSMIGNINDNQMISADLGWVYARSGEGKKAEEILARLQEMYENNNLEDPLFLTTVYAGLGETEKAFDYLEKGYEIRSGSVIYLHAMSNTIFQNLSSDPRYTDILRKVGFEVE